MDLLGGLLGLPLAPLRGVVRLTEILHEQAERELRDSAAIRRELERAEEDRAAGRVSRQEEQRRQQRVVNRLAGQPGSDQQTAKTGDARGAGSRSERKEG